LLSIFGAFANLQKTPISFVVSVCPSVHLHGIIRLSMNEIFSETWYLSIFRKYTEKIQVLFKYDKNNGYFTWKSMYIYNGTSINSA
jgi:hypothetical protein